MRAAQDQHSNATYCFCGIFVKLSRTFPRPLRHAPLRKGGSSPREAHEEGGHFTPVQGGQGGRVFARVGVFVSLIVASFQASVADTQPPVVAAPYSVQGEVSAQRIDSKDWVPVKVGNAFRVGDTVRTGADGQVAFKFVDGTLVRLGRLSAIKFKEVSPSGVPVVTQGNGKA